MITPRTREGPARSQHFELPSTAAGARLDQGGLQKALPGAYVPTRCLDRAGVLQALPLVSRTGTAEDIVKQVLSRPGLTQELLHFS